MKTINSIIQCKADFYCDNGKPPSRIYLGDIQWRGVCDELSEVQTYPVVPDLFISNESRIDGMRVFLVQSRNHICCARSKEDLE